MILKTLANAAAEVLVVPALLSFRVRSLLMGRERAFLGSTQLLALAPGLTGQYLRRAFLRHVVRFCDRNVVIGFGTLLSDPEIVLEANVYVGPHCDLGRVYIERDALIAAGVHIPSGPHTHGMEDLTTPIRDQPGSRQQIRIGAGVWIGNNAVVLADVGENAVVGAGAVVTRVVPPFAVVAGVPAKVIHLRRSSVES